LLLGGALSHLQRLDETVNRVNEETRPGLGEVGKGPVAEGD